jgi:hypothetical protein
VLTRCKPKSGVWKRLVPHNRRVKVIENPDFESEDIGEINKLVRSDRRTMEKLGAPGNPSPAKRCWIIPTRV